jgi:predicted hotdog family 3-hydroxylacyl-ACP dehydratase
MTPEALLALPLEALLPHRPPMILLDRLLRVEEDTVESEVTLRPDSQFVRAGEIGAWVGIEYMAQTVALLAGARAQLAGSRPRVGLLLGTRDYQVTRPAFFVGEVLRITAHQLMADPSGLSVLECRIVEDGTGELLAQGTLTGAEVDDLSAFLREHRT